MFYRVFLVCRKYTFSTGGTALMQRSLLLLLCAISFQKSLDSASIPRNPSFLPRRLVCYIIQFYWAGSSQLLRHFLPINTSKCLCKFLSFLTSELTPSSEDMSGQIYCLTGGELLPFLFLL